VKIERKMRTTTLERHKKVREAFYLLAGTMPLNRLYLQLGEQFGYSDEYIRQICSKKRKKPP